MENEEISLNEEQNDGKTIRLYFNNMVGFYVAYGKSAFYVTHVTNPVLSYSREMQMPVALVSKGQIFELRQACRKVEHTVQTYYRFETRSYIGSNGYRDWADRLQQSVRTSVNT